MKKYDLVDCLALDKENLYQIKALVDIPYAGVKAGELGGWIAGFKNLSQEGQCWVYPHCFIHGTSLVKDNAIVKSNSMINGHGVLGGFSVLENFSYIVDAEVSGNVILKNHARVCGDGVKVIGDMCLTGGIITSGEVYDSKDILILYDATTCSHITFNLANKTFSSISVDNAHFNDFFTFVKQIRGKEKSFIYEGIANCLRNAITKRNNMLKKQ